jgi:signal transduction histidine kinase
MEMLIHDLLEYSHVNMGLDLVEEISLNKKVALALSDLEIAIQEKGATITVGDLPSIRGHRRQLQQLFHNLIQNALKYSKEDVPPEITITAEEVTGDRSTFDLPDEQKCFKFYLIQVRDNGIGFDPQHAETIFQVFKRLHGKGVYSGSGVGLAIVRKVVENHLGHIKAEGEPGKGATFKVLLPK